MSYYVVSIDGIDYMVDTDRLEICEIKELKPVAAKEKELLVKAFEILKTDGKIKID